MPDAGESAEPPFTLAFSNFNQDGKPGPDSIMPQCFPCHQAVKDRDFVFTRYAP